MFIWPSWRTHQFLHIGTSICSNDAVIALCLVWKWKSDLVTTAMDVYSTNFFPSKILVVLRALDSGHAKDIWIFACFLLFISVFDVNYMDIMDIWSPSVTTWHCINHLQILMSRIHEANGQVVNRAQQSLSWDKSKFSMDKILACITWPIGMRSMGVGKSYNFQIAISALILTMVMG